MRTCPTCGKATKNKQYCTDCRRKRNRRYIKTIEGCAAVLLSNVKTRSKKAKTHCDIDLGWIMTRLEAGVCERSGIAFAYNWNGAKNHQARLLSPSIDRIDNDKGYTKANCQVVLTMYNVAKLCGEDRHVTAMACGIASHVLRAMAETMTTE